MKKINLKNDILFKALFVRNPELLRNFLNSVLQFEGTEQIESIEVLNPELTKSNLDEKGSFLDLFARNEAGERFHVEMQAFYKKAYTARSLYYWSKVYSQQLKMDQDYDELKAVYSVHLLDFNCFQGRPAYRTEFAVLSTEKEDQFQLNNHLKMVYIELRKLKKPVGSAMSVEEMWLSIIKDTEKLTPEELEMMTEKNPIFRRVGQELDRMRSDDELAYRIDRRDDARRSDIEADWAELQEVAAESQREAVRAKQEAAEAVQRAEQKAAQQAEQRAAEAQKSTQRQIALGLLQTQMSLEQIAKVTSLSIEEIQALKKGSP